MRWHPLLVLLIIMATGGCGSDDPPTSPAATGHVYRVPERVAGDWDVAHVSDVGLDLALIEALFDQRPDLQHSMLVIKDGKLVVEEYFPGSDIPWATPWAPVGAALRQEIDYTRDTLHYQASVTKSFVSALIGIAIDQGLITSVDQLVKDLLPDYRHLLVGEKGELTVADLLTMRSGIRWGEYSTYLMDHGQDVWVEYVLTRPLDHPPGTVYRYNDGLSVVLAEIVGHLFDSRADRVAEEYLFHPLGITDYLWMRSPSNEIAGGWGLFLRPRDMARFGQLFLRDGNWDGEQIISESWVSQSTSIRVRNVWNRWHYGYHWWTEVFFIDGRSVNTWAANGAGGQRIFVVPAHDLVVVFTSGGETPAAGPEQQMQDFILPACR